MINTALVEVSGLAETVLGASSDTLRVIVTALLTELGPQRGAEILRDAGQRLGVPVQQAAPAPATVEGSTRPLLETLHTLTGMASTYLTVVDEAEGLQEVRYALNRGGPELEVAEGVVVPWEQTLCKRALDEGRAFTTDVAATWADSAPARALGIQSYISVPVRLRDGRLWGTLCASDRVRVPAAEQHLPTMTMFARLIAMEVERATALHAAQREAETDELTGCLTRRAVERWLALVRDSAPEAVAAAFADLNAFKQVNDTYGHAAGDAVLAALGDELRRRSRGDDVVGRLGGDEFAVIAPLATRDVAGFVRRWSQPLELEVRVGDVVVPVSAAIGVAVVPTRRARDVLGEADRAMYEAKRPAGRAPAP